MDIFNKQKRKYIKELVSGLKDKSKKGVLDEEIKELVTTINNHADYYTTSSCSGRILLYSISTERKKNETAWLFVSHNVVTLQEVEKNLENIPNETVFFRFEPLILHVVCVDLNAAQKLLQLCNTAGLKHSGIISLQKRIIIEIIGNDLLDAPIAANGKLLITNDGLAFFVSDANTKMKKNLERIERLRGLFF